jgi:hypothetical protein
MTGRPDGEPRPTAGDGSQQDPETFPAAGGGSSEGPSPAPGGDQEPGGPVPPYEGRRSSGAVEEGGADREGAHVGGATGPQVASAPADDPDATPLGRTASPADGEEEVDAAEHAPDPGVGPDHQSGTRRGEDQPR